MEEEGDLVGEDTVEVEVEVGEEEEEEEGAGRATTEAFWFGTFPLIADLMNFESHSSDSDLFVMFTYQRTITLGELDS